MMASSNKTAVAQGAVLLRFHKDCVLGNVSYYAGRVSPVTAGLAPMAVTSGLASYTDAPPVIVPDGGASLPPVEDTNPKSSAEDKE